MDASTEKLGKLHRAVSLDLQLLAVDLSEAEYITLLRAIRGSITAYILGPETIRKLLGH